jgi:hypothetical protein
MYDNEDDLLKIMDEMVCIIDKLYSLPKECPEIKSSKTYISMMNRTKILKDYMIKRTKEMGNLADRAELLVSMGGLGGASNDN